MIPATAAAAAPLFFAGLCAVSDNLLLLVGAWMGNSLAHWLVVEYGDPEPAPAKEQLPRILLLSDLAMLFCILLQHRMFSGYALPSPLQVEVLAEGIGDFQLKLASALYAFALMLKAVGAPGARCLPGNRPLRLKPLLLLWALPGWLACLALVFKIRPYGPYLANPWLGALLPVAFLFPYVVAGPAGLLSRLLGRVERRCFVPLWLLPSRLARAGGVLIAVMQTGSVSFYLLTALLGLLFVWGAAWIS